MPGYPLRAAEPAGDWTGRITGDPAELFDGAALADGLSPALRTPVSVLVAGGIVSGIFDGDVPAEVRAGARVIDASGATIVPSFVDCHSHLTLQGGAHWAARVPGRG